MVMDLVFVLWVLVFLTISIPCVSAPGLYTAAELGRHAAVFTRDELIEHYFQDGYIAAEIIGFLYLRHSIIISLRQLRRVLRRLRLRRREQSPLEDVVDAVQRVMNASGGSMGYRFMWRVLTTRYHLHVSQETVRIILRVLEPERVDARSVRAFRRRQYSNKGPNYLIHVDGWDKLKPYGVSVHAAIDGYSRRLLWMKVGRSNKNPRYVAQFFLEYVQKINGVPRVIRADRGTENSVLRVIQTALRFNDRDEMSGERSFLYGRSVANQRIEAFWSYFQNLCSRFWVNYMKDLRDSGLVDTSNDVHIECIRFCFTDLIQRDFTRAAEMWNQHRIRSQRNLECPSGKPDVLYFLPEVYGSRDYKFPLRFSDDNIEEVKRIYCDEPPKYGCSPALAGGLSELIGNNVDHFAMPNSPEEATQMLLCLIDIFY